MADGHQHLATRGIPSAAIAFDTDKAREHLALAKQELGLEEWPPIVLLTSDSPVSNIQSEWVQEVLKSKLGLTIKIDKQIFKQRLAKMTAGDFDIHWQAGGRTITTH